jgi:vacuolar protein sorting-associated protein 26
MSFIFKSPLDIEINLESEDTREVVEVNSTNGRKERLLLYKDGETVRGVATLRTRDNKKVEHNGIRVQLLGTIETHSEGNVTNDDFLSFAQEIAAPGELRNSESFNFEFRNVEKMYESYRGINVRLRYYLKVTVSRKSADIIKEKEIWVYQYVHSKETNSNQQQKPLQLPDRTNQSESKDIVKDDDNSKAMSKSNEPLSTVKMDVGIENCLHIEFEYSKNKYPLKGVIVGRIYFLLVRLKIKHMELSLIRRETVGSGSNQSSESTTVVRFEIMDGAPVKGETIPIRLFLGGFDLVPTYRDVNKKFSTRTFLSLVLIDEDARRYFKQSEIILYREE